MSDYNELMARYASASGDWDNWKSLYMEAYDFTFPNRNPYFQEYNDTPGQRKNLQVFDTTLCIAARKLVSKLHANLVPPSLQWFELEPSELVQDESQRKQVQTGLQELSRIMYNAFNNSNFDLAINEFFHDLIIGTAALQVFANDDEEKPIIFKSCPIDRLAPEQDAFDMINTVWREFCDVAYEDILRLWPNGKIPESLESVNNGKRGKYRFIEGVIYQPATKDYRIVVMWDKEPVFILDTDSKSSPWVVGRWSKSPREIGGRGSAIEALPTARTLNMMARFLMEAAAMNATPPWLGFSDGIFNPFTYVIKPNDIIPIAPESAMNLPLRKLDVSGDVSFGELTMNDLRTQINQIMYTDPTRPVQAPSQTATEIMIRQQAFLEEIAPAFSRIEVEILPKLIERVMYILTVKGILPAELNNDQFKGLFRVRFKSPLEQSQQLQDVQKLMQYDQALQSIVGEQAKLISYKLPELPTYLGTKFDINLELINSPEEIVESMAAAQAGAQDPNAGALPSSTGQTAQSGIPEEMGVTG